MTIISDTDALARIRAFLARLRLHTAMCGDCARFERQLPLLGKAARSLAGKESRDDV